MSEDGKIKKADLVLALAKIREISDRRWDEIMAPPVVSADVPSFSMHPERPQQGLPAGLSEVRGGDGCVVEPRHLGRNA